MQLKITHLKTKVAWLVVLAFAALVTMSNAGGTIAAGHGGRTGAPFDTSGACGSCHTGGTSVPTVTVQLLSGTTPVTAYIPGGSYTLKIRVASAGSASTGYHYGFQTVCVQSSTNNNINNWGALPGIAQNETWSGRNYIEQNATVFSVTYPAISIPWTAPVSGTGDVIFYAAGCVVNNNLLPTGDVGATGSLTITESSGCVPATLSTTYSNVTCNGYSDGSINLTATGGTGVTGYSWTGPGGYSAATANISGLSGGTYTCVVTSLGGCADTTTVTIIDPPALTATVTANSPVCPGATLTFTTTATGGTGGSGGYTYTWDGPNSFSSGILDPSVTGFSTLDTGVYTFSFMDILSCSFTTTIDVSLAPVPAVSLGPDTSICLPGGSITLGEVLTGDTYAWSTAATTPTITVTDTGNYSVVVTNSFGCTGSDTVHVASMNCSTGIEIITGTDPILLYPNPANEYITIHSAMQNIERISICNEYGEMVYNKDIGKAKTEQEIDISHFAAGIYSIRIKAAGNQLVRKLMIEK